MSQTLEVEIIDEIRQLIAVSSDSSRYTHCDEWEFIDKANVPDRHLSFHENVCMNIEYLILHFEANFYSSIIFFNFLSLTNPRLQDSTDINFKIISE